MSSAPFDRDKLRDARDELEQMKEAPDLAYQVTSEPLPLIQWPGKPTGLDRVQIAGGWAMIGFGVGLGLVILLFLALSVLRLFGLV